MSVYGSVDLDEFDNGPEASPYVDVAHDHGGYDRAGGCVRDTDEGWLAPDVRTPSGLEWLRRRKP